MREGRCAESPHTGLSQRAHGLNKLAQRCAYIEVVGEMEDSLSLSHTVRSSHSCDTCLCEHCACVSHSSDYV